MALERVRRHAELRGVRAHVGERGAGRLLHDVAELAGDLEAALARHARRLDEEDVAAHRRPREARGDSRRGGALGHLGEELRAAEEPREVAGLDDGARGLVVRRAGHLEGDGAGDAGDLPGELPHARLAGVVANERAQPVVAERQRLVGNGVRGALLRHEVALRDAHLLVGGVALQLDDLQAVAQRRREALQVVGGAHEEHLREVEGHLEVVVREGAVLLRVEHLEQSCLGRSSPPCAELVDLVEEHHRVAALGLAQRRDDASRQGADVGAAVPAELGLVAHAAQGDAHERAPRGVGDALPEGRLAHARRSREAQDRAAPGARELQHRHVLEDALLHVVEAGVVVVELLRHGLHPARQRRALGPRQVGQQLEVRADHVRLGLRTLHRLEAAQLAVRHGARLLREVGVVELLLERTEAVAVAVVVAKLPLQRADLLAHQGLALVLVHLAAHVLVDLGLELGHRAGLGHELGDETQPRRRVGLAEHAKLLVGGEPELRGDLVRHAPGVVVGGVHRGEGPAVAGRQLGHVIAQRLREEPGLVGITQHVGPRRSRGEAVRLAAHEVAEGEPRETLEHHPVAAVAGALDLHHPGDGADVVKVREAGVRHGGVALGDHAEEPAHPHLVEQRHGTRAPHRERQRRAGKQGPAPKRKQGEGGRCEETFGIAGHCWVLLLRRTHGERIRHGRPQAPDVRDRYPTDRSCDGVMRPSAARWGRERKLNPFNRSSRLSLALQQILHG